MLVLVLTPTDAATPPTDPRVVARVHEQLALVPDRARIRPHALPVADVAAGLRDLADRAALCRETGEALAIVRDDLVVPLAPLLHVLDDPRSQARVLTRAVTDDEPATAVVSAAGRVTHVGTAAHELAAEPGRRVAHLGLLHVPEQALTQAEAAWRAAAELVEELALTDVRRDLTGAALLALARAGVVVRDVPLAPFPGGTTGGQDPTELLDQVGAADQRRLALRRATRGADGVWSTFVLRRLSRHATGWALTLRLTPNEVTGISLVIGLLAAAFIATGSGWGVVVGAVLLQVSLLVDCVDGELARATRAFTRFGAWADLSSDRLKEYLVIAAIAAGAAAHGVDVWLLAAAAMVLQTVRHVQDYAFADTVFPLWTEAFVDRRTFDRTRPACADAPEGGAGSPRTREQGPVERLTAAGQRRPALHWIKQALHMQVGERWLVLSAGLLLDGPRGALVAYVALVGLAELWTLTGWTLRTWTRRGRGPLPEATGRVLADLLDLGLTSRRGWTDLARRRAAIRDDAPWPEPAPVNRLLRAPAAWLLPPLAMAIEGAAVLLAVSLTHGSEPFEAAYAWLAVAGWRRYDAFYRSRGSRPVTAVVPLLAGGWLLRGGVVVAVALWAPTPLGAVLVTGAVWLAVVVVPESIVSAVLEARGPAHEYEVSGRLPRGAALRLLALRVRRRVATVVARVLMAVLAPRRHALVAGLPDTEENSLTTALGLAEHYAGDVYLVANDPVEAGVALERVARLLGLGSARHRVRIVAKAGVSTFMLFIRAEVVAYTHGLYDSPRPVGRRLHVNLWHGTGPKWNANANFAQRIGAQAHSASSPLWGVEAVHALSMAEDTRLVPGNVRQDVMTAAKDRSVLVDLDLDPTRPLVLWMPTFRTSAGAGLVGLTEGRTFTAGAEEEDLAASFARRAAEHGVQLVAKPHRHDADRLSELGVRVLSTEDVLAAGLTLYQLIGLADAMISDYSSVWVDFLALDRPVVLHCPDIADYERARGLNRPHLRVVAPDLLAEDAATIEEFFTAVASRAPFRDDARRALAAVLEVPVGPAAERRTEAMLDALADLAHEHLGTDLGLRVGADEPSAVVQERATNTSS